MNPALSLWAGVAVLGFAMVFSVPRRTLPGIMLLAIAAHLVRSFMLSVVGASLPLASLVAALGIGFTAAVLAPRTDRATPIYAFAPVIPLIPGTYMFTALQALMALTTIKGKDIDATVNTALVSTSTATLTVIALAVGTIAPGLIIGRQLARLGDVLPGTSYSEGRHRPDQGTEEEAVL